MTTTHEHAVVATRIRRRAVVRRVVRWVRHVDDPTADMRDDLIIETSTAIVNALAEIDRTPIVVVNETARALGPSA